jgi:hypothetical protein
MVKPGSPDRGLIPACLVLMFVSSRSSMITIRGGPSLQRLPFSYMQTAPIYSFVDGQFEAVEGAGDEGGWVAPTSFSELYLPADLPLPKCVPALGVCLANGVPRYIMPSVITTLSTPDRTWRNRGVNSVPRASHWIDVFSPLVQVPKLSLSVFGQSVDDVRFLEDIDGAAAWDSVLLAPGSSRPSRSLLAPMPPMSLPVAPALEKLRAALLELPQQNAAFASRLFDGYAFIDVPVGGGAEVSLPKMRMRAFLTDIDGPQRLLQLEPADLDTEPLGELVVSMLRVSPGCESEFLPEAYMGLFEEGAVLID